MATAVRLGTLAEFLAWEHQQPERYERIGGVIRMMTGGTVDHNRITRNFAQRLASQLEGSACEVFTSDLKVTTPAGDVMYPDVVVVCGELSGKATKVETPVIVVEVLSESTAERDHGRKRWAYQAITTLAHLVYVDAARIEIEIATRAPDGRWWSMFLHDASERLRLETLGADVPVADVYAGTLRSRDAANRS